MTRLFEKAKNFVKSISKTEKQRKKEIDDSITKIYFQDNNIGEFNEERKYNEELMNNRFNFLLIVFGAVIIASFSVKYPVNIFILGIGSILIFQLTRTIIRLDMRLEIIMSIIYKYGKNHPVTIAKEIIEEESKDKESKVKAKVIYEQKKGVRQIIGIIIPAYLTIISICMTLVQLVYYVFFIS